MKNDNYQLHSGDCLELLATLPDNSVDSIVTDPPYGLSFMGKKWDYDVPKVEIWEECLRVLKPGLNLLLTCFEAGQASFGFTTSSTLRQKLVTG